LNPVEQALCSQELLVEFTNRLNAPFVEESKNVVPGFEPDAASGPLRWPELTQEWAR
jgi:hypothetical protein